jgi:hypothetical protein
VVAVDDLETMPPTGTVSINSRYANTAADETTMNQLRKSSP